MIFSTESELKELALTLQTYMRLPFVQGSIPGNIMENVLAYVRDAEVLNNYDFIDVVDKKNRIGWQVKSTISNTPLTWKRAKIENSTKLISNSYDSAEGCQELGNAIIQFCNDHAKHSLDVYNLLEIGYSRLILFPTARKIKYLERKLCDCNNPNIFNQDDYTWEWSVQKNATKKEQLPSFRGTNIHTGTKSWSWHGLGENQLHYTAEKEWWHDEGSNVIDFDILTDAIPLKDFLKLLRSY